MLSPSAACRPFALLRTCADPVLFSQALETLDNGKPYLVSYLVDLNMVIKCLRWGSGFPVLCFGWAGGEGVLPGRRKQKNVKDKHIRLHFMGEIPQY